MSATAPSQLPSPGGDDSLPDSTRQRILRAAFQLFHEQGYHATGVSTILREAGVNPGSMYHIFPSKEAVLIGVLEYALLLLRPAVIDPVEAKAADPIARIFALLEQYRSGMVLRGCRMGCPIGNLALEVSDDHAEARALIHRNFENWAAQVKGWLDAAGDRLPDDLDRNQFSRFILTVMEGGLMQAKASGDLKPFDDSVAQLRAYVGALQERARPPKRARSKTKSTKPRKVKR